VCFAFYSTALSATFLILRRNERDMIKTAYWFSCKVPVIPTRILWNLNFLDKFSKNTQIPYLAKSHPVGAELFHADERTVGQTDKQTDMTKLAVAFRNFANTPEKCAFCPHRIYVFCDLGTVQTATFVIHNINWLDFITKMKSVCCTLWSGSLIGTVSAFIFKWLKHFIDDPIMLVNDRSV